MLVVINTCVSGIVRLIGLYSTRNRTCSSLPPIPDVCGGLPDQSLCVVLDGKLYVLGGSAEEASEALCTVYVMDLASQGRWERCANMTHGRKYFGCGVLNGKIYVFGGSDHCWDDNPVDLPEMYDPNSDLWFPMKPTPSSRVEHYALAIGKELVLVDGTRYNPEFFDGKDLIFKETDRFEDVVICEDVLEFFNPGSGGWRVESFVKEDESLFVAQGRLHSMSVSGNGICLRGIGKSCIDLHSFSSADVEHSIGLSTPTDGRGVSNVDYFVRVQQTLLVEKELVAFLSWWLAQVDSGSRQESGQCVVQSSGFGGNEKPISWQKVDSISSVGGVDLGFRPCLCTLQL